MNLVSNLIHFIMLGWLPNKLTETEHMGSISLVKILAAHHTPTSIYLPIYIYIVCVCVCLILSAEQNRFKDENKILQDYVTHNSEFNVLL